MTTKTMTSKVEGDPPPPLLPGWKPMFFSLDVHAQLLYQMRLSMNGVESAVVIGRRGVGKTYSVHHMIESLETEEETNTGGGAGSEPRRILYYESSDSRGTKTGLIDLIEVLSGPLAPGTRRSVTPRALIELIATELKLQGIGLVCIDEAQKIDGHNLDQLRQVPDQCERIGHPMGLVLIGSDELRQSLAKIRQLGQRFSAEIHIPRLQASILAPHLSGFHPHLDPLRKVIGEKRWAVLRDEVIDATGGSFRRLRLLLINANQLSLHFRRAVDEDIVRLAVKKLAPED
jgi:type II secretory pathway predicted ATPase ExeA